MSTKDIKNSATEVVSQTWGTSTKTASEIEDILVKSRISMLIKAPFFGNLATRLKFVDATKWCPTLATDGKNFYYNRDFVDALSQRDGEMEFGLGHEVLHCVYDHMNKDVMGDRDRRLANIAQDYVINLDLVEANVGKKIEMVEICFDWSHRGKHWLEVYDELFENAEKVYVKSFDMHLDGEGDGEPQDAPGEGDNDGSEGPIKYTDEEKQQIRQEVQSATIQAAKAAGSGNLPSGVKRLLDDLLNPQLDWRELLAMQIQSVIKSDYTWMNPSRKGMDAGMYLPGMDRETTIDIAIALDMSGSIDDAMSRDFLSEVKGIMDQYTDFNIHLFCFDTDVHNPQVFTQGNMDDFMSYELAGGGGTEFDCCWNYMKENGIQPKKFIMFTDGYPWNSWGDESYCDTLFIVHGGGYGEPPVAPFGITVPYERA